MFLSRYPFQLLAPESRWWWYQAQLV